MRTVFLTGGTGAIGSVLARHILVEEDARLLLLLRATSPAHLEERVARLFEFWGLGGPDLRARVTALSGDVTFPQLGLDPETYAEVVRTTTHVIHSAGNVKLNRPLEEARLSAVEAVRNILSLAADGRSRGSLLKLDYVSTVGVAGRTAGVVPEQRFERPREFRNSYETAKAEAETVVLGAMDCGLPVTIHRPSMIVGDSRDGRIIQFQVFYYLCEFLSGRQTRGFVPESGATRLDIVPVDYVARAIQQSSLRADAAGRIFHLCAGPDDAPVVTKLIERVREYFVRHDRTVPPLHRLKPGVMRTLLPVVKPFVGDPTRRMLQGLPFFLAYLDEPQTFDNAASRRFFSPAGLSVPPVDTYLEPVLSYYLSRQRNR
jgi:thioester reductase-like protein